MVQIDHRCVYFVYLIFIEHVTMVFLRSTQPIMVHKRTAICKSQLEAIIKKPGNTRGVGTSFWSLIRRRTIPGFSFVCNTGYTWMGVVLACHLIVITAMLLKLTAVLNLCKWNIILLVKKHLSFFLKSLRGVCKQNTFGNVKPDNCSRDNTAIK